MKTFQSCGRCRAFTFLDLLVVLAPVVLFLFVGLPILNRPACRGGSRINCVSNLKQAGLAFRMWAGDHGDTFPMSLSTNQSGTMEFTNRLDAFQHFRVLSNELNIPKVLACNSDTKRSRANTFDPAAPGGTVFSGNIHLSYFVGLDANENVPQMILSGDRDLTGVVSRNGQLHLRGTTFVDWGTDLHNRAGNIGLADGSAQQVTGSSLRLQVENAFRATNLTALRILLPVTP